MFSLAPPASARRRGPWRAAGLLAAALLLAACGRDAPTAAGAPAGMRGGPVAVVAIPVESRPFVDRFTALGTARANESIEVTSRIASVVTRIGFEEGQQVAAGDLLVELENSDLRAQLAVAEAAQQKVHSQFERRKQLAATRVISAAELEEMAADVAMADADVRGAEARLRNAFVRAPFSGTVGLRRISLGDLVGPDTVITTLDDMATLKLEFTVPETYLAAVHDGMAIEAASSVFPGERFAGQISSIDTRVDPTTRTAAVIARLPNPERRLKPGMFLTVELQRERDDVLLIPEEALNPRQGRQYVYVVQDGRAVEREVSLGIRAPGLAEVSQGLDSGEVVITEGTQKVRDGTPVQLLSAG